MKVLPDARTKKDQSSEREQAVGRLACYKAILLARRQNTSCLLCPRSLGSALRSQSTSIIRVSPLSISFCLHGDRTPSAFSVQGRLDQLSDLKLSSLYVSLSLSHSAYTATEHLLPSLSKVAWISSQISKYIHHPSLSSLYASLSISFCWQVAEHLLPSLSKVAWISSKTSKYIHHPSLSSLYVSRSLSLSLSHSAGKVAEHLLLSLSKVAWISSQISKYIHHPSVTF
ncbi:hypothetical protein J6590_017751 [Homalodisca vitripennis]|nr:hypothetical protein J6590_017751 [Homalodisca vitripennis]